MDKFNINEFLKTSDAMSGPFRWEAKTFKIIEVSRDKIRIKGVALHAGEISKNNNKYVREAVIKATNTWIGKPLILNHKASEVVGNVELMDFNEESGNLEYTGLVNKQPYVNMIRDKSTAVRGVSIGADYLAIKCSKCGEKFDTEEMWYDHATNKEFMRNLPREPHGIIGKDLSLVLAPETPGCNTTVRIAETVAPMFLGLTELFNKVISESCKEEKNMVNTVENKKIVESTPQQVEAKPLPQTIQIREAASIPKLVFEATPEVTFEQCIKDGGSEEECALKIKKNRMSNEQDEAVTETVNKIIEYLSQPVVMPAQVDYAPVIVQVETKLSSAIKETKDAIPAAYDDKGIKEMVAAIPKDDLGWKEAIAQIKPYDDAPLKEMIAKIPVYNDALLKEQVAAIKPYNDAPIKEMLIQQRKDFETILAVADKNITETRKTLETRIQELTKTNQELKETVADQAKTIKETAILADNTADKLKPQFKGKSEQATEKTGLPNLVKPY